MQNSNTSEDKDVQMSVRLIECIDGEFDQSELHHALKTDGVAVVRGLVSGSALDGCREAIAKHMQTPEAAGVPGYWKVDHAKVIQKATSVGGPIIPLLVDSRVTTAISALMGGDCVLSEATVKYDFPTSYIYFPMHRDFLIGWKKTKNSELVLSESHMDSVLGVNCIYYLEDTVDGALQYVKGSHLKGPYSIGNYTDLPRDERKQYDKDLAVCSGQAGDMVIFDSRGFHGPAQPSQSPRQAILLEYYNTNIFGHTQVSPMPLWSCDLKDLTTEQLFVLGVGAGFLVPVHEYTYTRFRNNGAYKFVSYLIENAYLLSHVRQSIKTLLVGSKQ